MECVNPGVYFVDTTGQIVGYADHDTIATDKKLFPLPVDEWRVKPVPISSDTEVAMAEVTITFPRTMNLCKWVILSDKDHLYNSLKNYEPSQASVAANATPATTATLVVDVTQNGLGILGNNAPVTGLEPSDFTLFNATQTTALTVATAVESPNGTYTLTFSPAATIADVVSVLLSPTSTYIATQILITIP